MQQLTARLFRGAIFFSLVAATLVAANIGGCTDSTDPVVDAGSATTPDTSQPDTSQEGVACVCDTPGPCQIAAGASCPADGSCVYPALECDDGDPCTGVAICDPMKGCVASDVPECDDGDQCNGDETCEAGVGCVAAASLTCDDADACNGMETCDPGAGCVAGTALVCNDALACNGVETCQAATGCVAGTPTGEGCCEHDSDCEDGNVCNGVGSCDMATWICVVSPAPSCDDGNPCNGSETCDAAAGCTAGAPLQCPDGNACNGQEFCDPALGCTSGAAPECDDGNLCNGQETCHSATGCVLGTAPDCNDGDLCNGAEGCAPATGCTSGVALSCDDGVECTGEELCDSALGCVSGPAPAGCCAQDIDCDDGNACNGAETCGAGGACLAGTSAGCDDANPCTTDSCDPASGGCSNSPTDCDDANACTSEQCGPDGACQFALVVCDDLDACTADTCSPADGCVLTPLPCDDGNVCNGEELCNAAAGCLGGVAVVCDDSDVCNGVETCDAQSGACLTGTGLVCTDGNPCNGSETCDAWTGCQPGKAMNCDDSNACTQDSCDTNTWQCVNDDVCAAAMTDGAMVYTVPSKDGNTWACNTCHALEEPSEDGVRRVGHRLGDATHRATYKDGSLTNMRDAVNSCRTGWMNAPAWDADDPEWLALYQWLDDMAPEGPAPLVDVQIVTPPDPATGGDPDSGQTLFNMACVMCHGTDAVGTERGPPLAGVGLPESYIVGRVRTSGPTNSPVYDGLTGGLMPFWGGDRLTDTEVKNLAAFVNTVAAPDPDTPDDPDPVDPGPFCDATHAKVGWTATLSTKFHGVSGTATIIDDCTIEVTEFAFDGNGIDVQVYAGTGGNYNAGFSVSEQLYNYPTGYSGDTLMLKVPAGNTLDDIDGLSVWCVAVGVSFGDGLFAPPPEPPTDLCSADHAKVGWTTTLSTKFHGVKGTATITDDCTIQVTGFFFDGNGIDVQVYAGNNGQYGSGFSVSDQLYNFPIGYSDDALTLKVPDGKTLDDIGGISVWCVAVGVSFGDGLFAAP
ncbi:MAG: cytochrome c [Myxococcota bacterium]|jgi:cytochrome c